MYNGALLLADERDDEPEDEEKTSLFEKIRASFPLLMAWLYKHRDFTYKDMNADEVQKFVNEVAAYFNHAVDTSIREVPMAEVSVQRLKESNYVFSGIKVFHELNEAFPSMVDDKGEIRPFEDFLKDVQKINNTYNGSYLKTEYNFARQSSLAAAQWKNYEKDGYRYNLQYRTAYDDRVRTSHRKLEGITLPITSKFWDDYFPPNGWNCRCTVVQVRKDKYAESDERTAIDLGSQATAGKHQEMFKFNPGKEMTTFPAYNAYTIRKCKNCKYNGTMKLAAEIPDNELCAVCKYYLKCAGDITKSRRAIERKHYEMVMEHLYDKKVHKEIKDGSIIKIEFNKDGNAHLYSDAISRSRRFNLEDLKNIDEILKNASILDDAQKREGHNNPYEHFYYYESDYNGGIILNVGKKVNRRKNGRVDVSYICYSVTDKREAPSGDN